MNGLAQNQIASPDRLEARIVAGAIRWDAWHSGLSEVGKTVERSLGPRKWHGRLPFFAEITGEGRVQIDGVSQRVMDQEIQYARTALLDYWAFLLYDQGSAMNLGLESYLASKHKDGLSFCVILEQANWKTNESAAKQLARVAALTALPEYQTVGGNRPLIYILAAEPGTETWGTLHGRTATDQLRSLVRSKGRGEPYLVIQHFRAERANALRKDLNADGISAYAYQRDGKNASYATLAQETEQFWEECRSTGSEVVPIVMTGWDRRPRVERPVFWENQKANDGIEKFYHAPTAAELSKHLRHAIAWVRANPEVAVSKAILVYAWNENDEGGWLVPTLDGGTWRIQAVKEALQNDR